MSEPTFSICLPAYNSANIIGETLQSVFTQTYQDFEIVIVDDCSTDDTEGAIRSFNDNRVRYFRNEKNLGIAGNLARCVELARGKYLYLLGNDDILSPIALERTILAFESDPDVALVTRPYYWFLADDLDKPIRAVQPYPIDGDMVVSINDDQKVFSKVLETLGQISGLAFRRSAFDGEFSKDVFTTHIDPALRLWRDHKAVLLKDYVVAVRVVTSQTRYLSSIYDPSPTQTWIDMFDRVFADPRYRTQREWGHEHIARHFEGLVQIRCYAPTRLFWKEVGVLVKYRKRNLLLPLFWGYVLFLALVPRAGIITIVDKVKPFVTGSHFVPTIRLAT